MRDWWNRVNWKLGEAVHSKKFCTMPDHKDTVVVVMVSWSFYFIKLQFLENLFTFL